MESPVQLVFFGEVLRGFQREDVQRELTRLLKLDERRQRRLFSGKRTVLKRSLAREDAERYARRLARAGALVHVEPMAAPHAASAVAGGRTRRLRGLRWPPRWPVRRRWLLAAPLAVGVVAAALGAWWLIGAGREPGLPPELAGTAGSLPAAAAQAFGRGYAPAPAHKAFAVSAGGSWGWLGSASSVDEAMSRALADCEARRQPDTPACEVIHTQ